MTSSVTPRPGSPSSTAADSLHHAPLPDPPSTPSPVAVIHPPPPRNTVISSD